jgi:trimeric autotransporter adhesin
MKTKLFTILMGLIIFLPVALFSAEISVYDASINPNEKVYWTNDNIYVLEEIIFIEDGSELHIEPGTVIWGKEGQELDAKALVVARGGKIFAEGTPSQPIIFTAYGDDPYDFNDGFSLTETGLWGGIIILGKAPNNNVARGYIQNIEGIDPNDPRGLYGETPDKWDPMDNSGILRYVHIRHGGTDIGEGNEINGLTMGAVGAGTLIEFVEVWYNKDDGFEWFGGTVNASYLVSAFNRDDSFDYDEGWSGKGQFWFAIQAENRGNMLGEHDGGNKPDDSKPYAKPEIYNVTYIGSGVGSSNTDSKGIIFRDNACGTYANSIIMETNGRGLEIEDLESDNPNSTSEDSRKRLEAGDLKVHNNIWWNIGSNNTTIDIIAPDSKDYSQDFLRDYLSNAANHNYIENPLLKGISINFDAPNGGLDPRPEYNSPAFNKPVAQVPQDDFFVQTDYYGAFGPGDLWLDRWTMLSQSGLLKQLRKNEVSVYDASINPGEKVYWTSDNIYVLEEMVFVEDGSELHIEPGTVIWGKEGQELDAKGLVIARGGKIFADGTKSQPIIFTAYGDDPFDLTDGFALDETGLWGSLIMLGKAPNNNVARGYIQNIEGLDPNDPRGLYGETPDKWDPMDNSGVLRYVQLRHGGTDIGEGNEINGLTMGAVGAGTIIEFVEVWYNKDDGFEWFGGTVNGKYLASMFNRDDSFDYDEGWSGKGQFWFALQAPNRGNMLGEHDGGNKPDDTEPYAIPFIYNVTYIGSGVGSQNTDSKGIILRDNAGGIYKNSIFAETTGRGLEVEDLESDNPGSTSQDSRKRLEAQQLQVRNNIWWKIANNNTTIEIIAPDSKDYSQDFVRAYLADPNNQNSIEDPMFYGVNRNVNSPDYGLDPRPMPNSPAYTKPRANFYFKADENGNAFFDEVNHLGAFGDLNWMADWTFASQCGLLNYKNAGQKVLKTSTNAEMFDFYSSVEEQAASLNSGTLVVYPNPVEANATIEFFVDNASQVKVSVRNILGQEIAVLTNKYFASGLYGVKWTPENIQSGMYIIICETENSRESVKIIVK